MAILSTLLSVAKPTGMWESIIWAFDSFTNNYIWAVVLITVIIRLIWSPLDTYNRRITSKNTAMQEKMKPELEKIQAKYGNDRQLLNQKTNEIYKKHNYNMAGSCGFMAVFMILNLVVFFTLFTGLNKISNYKIYENYDFLKEDYANCLNVVNVHTEAYKTAINEGKDLEFRVFVNGEDKMIGFFEKESQQAVAYEKYLTLEDFKAKDEIDITVENDVQRANDVINIMIEKFANEIISEKEVENDEGVPTLEKVTLLGSVVQTSMPLIEETYKTNQESFLWIQNIWIADSPLKSSMFTYEQFEGMVRKNNIEKGEKEIYNSFMLKLQESQSKVNGYFILPVLIIAVSFLSSWLSQFLMRRNLKKKGKTPSKAQGRIMQIVMPLIMGIFAIFYNAVFSIYMLASQLISTALLPLQDLIVNKLEANAEKKEAQKNANTMDYRRKQ